MGNPTISGTPQVGQTLTATHGVYSGTVTGYFGQWFSGASAISLATALTYVPQSSDLGNSITYEEYASNAIGSSATGTSNAIGPIVSAGGGSLGGSGTLSALTLGYPTPNNSNPTSILIGPIPADYQAGASGSPIDSIKMASSSSPDMGSPMIAEHVLVDGVDVPGGSFSFPLPEGTPGTPIYFVAFGSHSGTDSQYLSNMVAWGSAAAPVITTSATQSHNELTQYAVAITANETLSKRSDAVWISGGADQTQFEVYQDGTGAWFYRPFGNGTFDADNPVSVGGTNAYSLQITATDLFGNTSVINITDTIQSIRTAATFSLGANQGPPSTAGQTYLAPNLVTISGLGAGITVPWSVTNGTASQNGGAQASSGTCGEGDTLQVEGVAPSSSATVVTLAVGSGSHQVTASWSIITSAIAFNPATASTILTFTNGNLTVQGNAAGAQYQGARATAAPQASKTRFEVTIAGAGGGTWASGKELVVGVDNNSNYDYHAGASPPGKFGEAFGCSLLVWPTGWKTEGPTIASGSATFAVGDVIGVEIDEGAKTVKFTHIVSGVETVLTTVTGLSPATLWAIAMHYVDTKTTANFKGPFVGTISSGFVPYSAA